MQNVSQFVFEITYFIYGRVVGFLTLEFFGYLTILLKLLDVLYLNIGFEINLEFNIIKFSVSSTF